MIKCQRYVTQTVRFLYWTEYLVFMVNRRAFDQWVPLITLKKLCLCSERRLLELTKILCITRMKERLTKHRTGLGCCLGSSAPVSLAVS